jgi:hypothetical protein
VIFEDLGYFSQVYLLELLAELVKVSRLFAGEAGVGIFVEEVSPQLGILLHEDFNFLLVSFFFIIHVD